jgi:hypothetical protein
MTTWAETLDRFEARLAQQRAALDRGELAPVPPFVPPKGLGELRGADLDRARALLNEAEDLQAEIEGALAHTREDLTVVRRLVASTAGTPTARFVDASL